MCFFYELTRLLNIFSYFLTHLVIIPTLLMNIYQKSSHVAILISIFGPKHCDIRFCCPVLVFMKNFLGTMGCAGLTKYHVRTQWSRCSILTHEVTFVTSTGSTRPWAHIRDTFLPFPSVHLWTTEWTEITNCQNRTQWSWDYIPTL